MKNIEVTTKIIPTHIQIENINGVCTSRCVMCAYKDWTRAPKVMTSNTFKKILQKFLPYREQIKFLTIHGYGEPLLDRELPRKVLIAKKMGFKGIGFATNCTELREETASDLLHAGLDTIICSIDGFKKKTHERIRIGTDFDKIVSNVQNFIVLRNKGDFPVRVLVRFIRQEINMKEWPVFFKYWSDKIDRNRGDDVIKFGIHNWGNKIACRSAYDVNKKLTQKNYVCSDLFERMFIYSNGGVALCCGDDNGFFDHGNVLDLNPIDIYNNEIFSRYRQAMLDGKIAELKYCAGCTIPRSRALKDKKI